MAMAVRLGSKSQPVRPNPSIASINSLTRPHPTATALPAVITASRGVAPLMSRASTSAPAASSCDMAAAARGAAAAAARCSGLSPAALRAFTSRQRASGSGPAGRAEERGSGVVRRGGRQEVYGCKQAAPPLPLTCLPY